MKFTPSVTTGGSSRSQIPHKEHPNSPDPSSVKCLWDAMYQWMGQVPFQSQHIFRDPGPCPLPQPTLKKTHLSCGFVSGSGKEIITIFQSQTMFKCYKTWTTANLCAFRWEQVKPRGFRGVTLFYHLSDEKQKVTMKSFFFFFSSCRFGVDKTSFYLIDLFVSDCKPFDPPMSFVRWGKHPPHLLPSRRPCAKAPTNTDAVFTHPPEAHTFWENCNHSLIQQMVRQARARPGCSFMPRRSCVQYAPVKAES